MTSGRPFRRFLWRGSAVGVAALAALGAPAQSGSVPAFPDRLDHAEFARLIHTFSEADTPFISDNLVSNELSLAQVVPELEARRDLRHGAFLGVGPEQNFSYIAALRPAAAFIVDIRRDNQLLHLLYKALFELSSDRAEFVARLFVRARVPRLARGASAANLFASVDRTAAGDVDLFERRLADVRRVLMSVPRLLSDTDLDRLGLIYRTFHMHGPAISYTTRLAGERGPGIASYAVLMTQVDARGRELSFLSSDAAFAVVKEMQRRNLIVPIVGNFAGPKAIRAAGDYLRSHATSVGAFYVSNVEEYLGRAPIPANGAWTDFCANVATLPIHSGSVFIRPLGTARFSSTGALTVARSLTIVNADKDAIVHPDGSVVRLPSALAPIAAEISACRR